eukprot:CAMPEP_0183771652 /NCGR_PEP_ID=MMETSP0739-20130205/33243_1 /TAXON_ID=385413 /ORGANISM="Thalassiosira miniscula, Strain CCMP1093" /LENGTH=220 /DNA_ID=CAMNT_0026012101 /DNA_START=1 /DNA_END=661 /DNA_ORIENTATION=-
MNERQAQQELINHISKEKEVHQQAMNHLSQEKDDAKYQVSVLENENMELRARLTNYEALQSENIQLRAKLAAYDTIQQENSQLRAKLASNDATQRENAKLRDQVAKLQDIQSQFSNAVDIAERRESARIQAYAERRKALLEMLAVEEKQDQAEKSKYMYRGETLERAFRQQVRSMEGLQRDMHQVEDGIDGDGLRDVMSPMNHRKDTVAGYRMNNNINEY